MSPILIIGTPPPVTLVLPPDRVVVIQDAFSDMGRAFENAAFSFSNFADCFPASLPWDPFAGDFENDFFAMRARSRAYFKLFCPVAEQPRPGKVQSVVLRQRLEDRIRELKGVPMKPV